MPANTVAGLTLDSDGTLSGVPTEAGEHTLHVIRTDLHGNKISRDFVVRVAAAEVPPTGDGDGEDDGEHGTTVTGPKQPVAATGAGAIPLIAFLAAALTLAGVALGARRRLFARVK